MNFKEEKMNLVLFIVITFLISWLSWLPSVLVYFGIIPSGPIQIMGQLAIFGPFIAAFALTLKNSGKVGAKALFISGWNVRFNKKWLVVLFLPILISLIAFLTVSVIEPMNRLQYATPVIMWIPNFIIFYFIGGPFTEEYGWRGYALDRIQSRFNALFSSLILGLIWGLWHLPLFFISGTVQENIPIYEFLLVTVVLSVFYTWILNNNRDKDGKLNVFLAIMFHAMSNFSSMILPYWVTGLGRWILFILTAIVVIAICVIYGIKTLTKLAENQE